MASHTVNTIAWFFLAEGHEYRKIAVYCRRDKIREIMRDVKNLVGWAAFNLTSYVITYQDREVHLIPYPKVNRGVRYDSFFIDGSADGCFLNPEVKQFLSTHGGKRVY